jgi:hypothetical protein
MLPALMDVGGTLSPEGPGGPPATGRPRTSNSVERHRKEWERRLKQAGATEDRIGARRDKLSHLIRTADETPDSFDVWAAIDEACAEMDSPTLTPSAPDRQLPPRAPLHIAASRSPRFD